MRLINSQTIKFHEFEQSSSEVPPYAILSHTWGDEEVTFRDMNSEPMVAVTQKKGYAKIMETCRLAHEQNLKYVWIDTCCIDKSSSAELSESINSMFKWYEHAAVCYVFLSDFNPDKMELGDCRWWTRGWTLQELLAPETLIFYDAAWNPVGTNGSLITEISKITRIEEVYFQHIQRKYMIFQCPVSKRMEWASCRQTTRTEDQAYCLLGIFGINMPLLYGEGHMAFRRLQEEIIKRNSDMTIFFWDWPENDVSGPERKGLPLDELQLSSLFAESPSAFRTVDSLSPFLSVFPEFFITNKGVFFSHTLQLSVVKVPGTDYRLYGFWVGQDCHTTPQGILLRKVGPGVYCRVRHITVRREAAIWKASDTSFYIIPDPGPDTEAKIYQYRTNAFHIPHTEQFHLQRVSPRRLFDATDRIFLHTPITLMGWVKRGMQYSMAAVQVEARLGSANVELIVLFNYSYVKIFDRKRYPEEAEFLFGGENEENPICFSDLSKNMGDMPHREIALKSCYLKTRKQRYQSHS
ncbi:hypothetical protein RRF57_010909 [Xylaria bambusicola]|uniref:Heterokaryon incompatibility domain-containing protein n=1 Tax=Xylaria bambusicola TaxID=326684 RepID=A0AAN7Z9T2_9PEZI